MKIKVIQARCPMDEEGNFNFKPLEVKVNAWLEANPNINVIGANMSIGYFDDSFAVFTYEESMWTKEIAEQVVGALSDALKEKS